MNHLGRQPAAGTLFGEAIPYAAHPGIALGGWAKPRRPHIALTGWRRRPGLRAAFAPTVDTP